MIYLSWYFTNDITFLPKFSNIYDTLPVLTIQVINVHDQNDIFDGITYIAILNENN